MAQPQLSPEDISSLPDQVQHYLTALQQHSNTLQAQVAQQHVKPPKLENPTTFDGTRNSRLLEEYLYDVKQHFKNDPLKFYQEDTKIRFAGSYLKNTARVWFRTMDQSGTDWHSFDGFELALKEHFSELDPAEYWRRRWDSLQQRGPIASYLADFQAISMHLELTEQDKYHHFKKGLRPSVLDQLALLPRPDTFQELVKIANQIDSRLFDHLKSKFNNNNNTGQPQQRLNRQPLINSAQRLSNSFNKANNFNFNRGQQQRPSPPPSYPNNQPVQNNRWFTPVDNKMQLDMVNKGPISEAQRNYRRLNNLCLYCGQSGHTAYNCPLKRNRPSNNGQPPKPKN